MMRRIFWVLLSIAFPWFVLLIHDNPGGALVAMVMQASVIGWIPASIWAMRTVNAARANAPKKHSKESSGS
jgi:multisubunit Na+/H+ antiporter MnhB subunit